MPKEFDPRVTAFVRENLPARLSPTLTLKQQAAQIGVSDAQLHAVLSGTGSIGKKTLPKFATALGLSADNLINQSREAAAKADAVQRQRPPERTIDTLSMADDAARDLTELDQVRPGEAWAIMRDIRPPVPTPHAFYAEARRRLGVGEHGQSADKPSANPSSLPPSAGPAALDPSRKPPAFSKAKKLFKRSDKRSGTKSRGA